MLGFVIMQSGDPELDTVYDQAIAPALEACGLAPRRVDKHNEGDLLKSEIIRFINEATILVADLSNERPNVYLEVGYAMGVDKFRNLVLTVRQDHFLDAAGRTPGDPKIHFDLAGYDILGWDPANLARFREDLEKRIRRRMALVQPSESTSVPVFDQEWLQQQYSEAVAGLERLPHPGRMTVRAAVHPPKPSKDQRELLDAARQAEVRTFGWPIGLVMDNVDEARPKVRADGIYASVEAKSVGPSYDYWAIRRNGDFYTVKSIFEDKRQPGSLFFNTRIVRVTEALLYCLRLYDHLGLDRATRVSVAIGHSGLRGRELSSSSPTRHIWDGRKASENAIETQIEGELQDIEAQMVDYVKQIVAPLLMLFDFFALEQSVYEDIVGSFLKGQVT